MMILYVTKAVVWHGAVQYFAASPIAVL